MKKSSIKQALAIAVGIIAAGIAAGYSARLVKDVVVPPYTSGDYSSYFPSADQRTILYTIKGCRYCAKTKAYFTEHHIQYLERDIADSGIGSQQFHALKGESVPIVLIGNRLITGYNPSAFDAAISALSNSDERPK
jgi:mycoredoxin